MDIAVIVEMSEEIAEYVNNINGKLGENRGVRIMGKVRATKELNCNGQHASGRINSRVFIVCGVEIGQSLIAVVGPQSELVSSQDFIVPSDKEYITVKL